MNQIFYVCRNNALFIKINILHMILLRAAIAVTTSTPAAVRTGQLGVGDGIAIIVGIVIGSGIFSSPGLALSRCGGSPGEVLLAWSLSGVLVILTAHCYIE